MLIPVFPTGIVSVASAATINNLPITYNLGVLFIATTQNPFAAKMGKSDVPALQLVYEPLVLVGLDGTITPWLAKSWSFDKTTSIYQVKLQENAKWSDGKDVTADDVKYSYETYWAISHPQGLPTQPMVESITVVDEHTDRVYLLFQSIYGQA
ncbi:MAG: ABC transporter substrate-binding protein [Chloroflexi bacterium]|nr:ABC transporter substrate-binding protein [Chloroflexota bacterium]